MGIRRWASGTSRPRIPIGSPRRRIRTPRPRWYFIISHEGDPLTPEGIEKIEAIKQAAKEAIKGTPLEGSKVYLAGTDGAMRSSIIIRDHSAMPWRAMKSRHSLTRWIDPPRCAVEHVVRLITAAG